MTPAVLLLGAVTAERIAELVIARRNTSKLLALGALEFAPGHYPAIVLLHALWLASLWIFGSTHPVNPAWLTIFLALQLLRGWTLVTLVAHVIAIAGVVGIHAVAITRWRKVRWMALLARSSSRLSKRPPWLKRSMKPG